MGSIASDKDVIKIHEDEYSNTIPILCEKRCINSRHTKTMTNNNKVQEKVELQSWGLFETLKLPMDFKILGIENREK